jgi:hypothetical protein
MARVVVLALATIGGLSGPSIAEISAIWANEGGDKVAQDELRVGAPNGRAVLSRCWDGTQITLFGAQNEVVSFNLVLEAATQTATNVTVAFDTLTGPGGAVIHSTPTSGDGVFGWVGRPIELFYIRYLQIKGLSQIAYDDSYDERHVPARLRRPWTGNGVANSGTTWQDRPDHDRFYPDIAVPQELVPAFAIAAGHNQSVWVDIYIPRTAVAGLYTGQVTIAQDGAPIQSVPVVLTVLGFSLPDVPTAKTMLYYSGDDVNERYTGQRWVQGADEARATLIQDRHFLLAHRHKIMMIGDGSSIASDWTTADHPGANFAARLQGTFFTAANGYDGPGVNVGNDVYSVETYGIPRKWRRQQVLQQHADGWASWFAANAPTIEHFLYLIDESRAYRRTNRWAQWLRNDPGPGHALMPMATLPLPAAVAEAPSIQVVASEAALGIPAQWEGAAAQYTHDPTRRFYLYNGIRPVAGTFVTDDDGVAPRVNAWIQFKKSINRWFYWESTYYDDFQGGSGKLDLFQSAHTFGTYSTDDPVQGQTGRDYSNGDGVLFYPGTDLLFPADSYGVDGPFASLRMKAWRRGLQDYEYLTLASMIDPATVANIVASVIPKVVWEVGVDNPKHPTYVHADISWSTDPDVWETARAQLAQIISGPTSGPLVTPGP